MQYEVYAFDNSVRTSWLDRARGFFNATSLCLMADGATDLPHAVDLIRSPQMVGWNVATGLPPVAVDKAGFGRYQAAHYDTTGSDWISELVLPNQLEQLQRKSSVG